MQNFSYHSNNSQIVFGRDTVTQAGSLCARYGKKVLLVTGGKSVRASGLFDRVLKSLQEAGLTVSELAGVQPNPRIDSVREGAAICKRDGIEIILAVGGGSVIDAAKGMAAGALYDGDAWDFYSGKAQIEAALPVGAILTLAATGSETNKNSVVSNPETEEKQGAGSPLLIPKFAILDPQLTTTVPLDQTTNGMVDIMAHVFEQYFSPTPNTFLLDRMAEAILKTVIDVAPRLLADPSNYDLRAEILWSGTLALNGSLSCGKAGDWATHMIEHEVSAIYDIPHGAGLAILFPNWMRHVWRANPAKFVNYAVNVWGIDPAGKSEEEIALAGITATREFFNRLNAPATLAHYGIGAERIAEMASKCTRHGAAGKFKALAQSDVEAILRTSL